MHIKQTQQNGLTIHCYATRDAIVLEFSTIVSEFSVNFERTSKVIIQLIRVFNVQEEVIDSFGITHRIRLEEYPTDYKLILDGQVYRLREEIVEQIRYLVNNIWRA